MRYRFMRVLVFFDLPMETYEDKRQYRKFRELLLKNGFIMMQKSVYYKIALNLQIADSIKNAIKCNLPKNGIVQLISVTEKQFASIEYLLGEKSIDIEDSDSRLVEV